MKKRRRRFYPPEGLFAWRALVPAGKKSNRMAILSFRLPKEDFLVLTSCYGAGMKISHVIRQALAPWLAVLRKSEHGIGVNPTEAKFTVTYSTPGINIDVRS